MSGDEQAQKIIDEATQVVRDAGITGASKDDKLLFLQGQMFVQLRQVNVCISRLCAKFESKPAWYKNRGAFATIGIAIGAAIAEIVSRFK